MYPIRASRSVWAKSFIRPHTCSELCNSNFIISDNLVRLNYQTGCLYPEKVEPAYIHLSENNNEANISYMDDLVPVAKQVTLFIDHPLQIPLSITHEFEDEKQVTLSQIVQLFRQQYEHVYREEEEKCTPREYWIPRKCTDCSDETYTERNLESFLNSAESEDGCSICFDDSEVNLVRIQSCGHTFHITCLTRWFNTPKQVENEMVEAKHNSCPMCRQPIITCFSCHADRIIKERYFGPVPPYEPNNPEQEDRPETDGPYHIHTIYFEELYFKGIIYDTQTKMIRLLPLERLNEEDN